MGKNYTIRLKFCGGCNPEIDRGSVVKAFKEKVNACKDNSRIRFDNGGEILLLVNGCAHACLCEDVALQKGYKVIISVQGTMIDLVPLNEEDLPGVLYQKIISFIT